MAKYKNRPALPGNGFFYSLQTLLYLIVVVAALLILTGGEPEVAAIVFLAGTGTVLLIWALFGGEY